MADTVYPGDRMSLAEAERCHDESVVQRVTGNGVRPGLPLSVFDPREAAQQAQQREMQRQACAHARPSKAISGVACDCDAKLGETHRIGCALMRRLNFAQLIEGYLMLRDLAVVPRSWIDDDLPGQIMKLREENAALTTTVARLARHVTCLGEMLERVVNGPVGPAAAPPDPVVAAVAAVNRGWKPTL